MKVFDLKYFIYQSYKQGDFKVYTVYKKMQAYLS